MKFVKLSEKAITPTYGSFGSAGMDLYSIEDAELAESSIAKIHTGICVEIPHGYFGAVFARSGLSTKHGLRPANCVGVIDSDYRGEIIVPLYNDSDRNQVVSYGDRVAQMVIMPYSMVELEEVEELSDTKRGSGGFGSTGA